MEGLYYPCSENKGDDQLRGHREADLCLCFRICKYPVSYDAAYFIKAKIEDIEKHANKLPAWQAYKNARILCMVY